MSIGPPENRKPVVVASHPRSGTHLLIDLIRRQFSGCKTWKWPLERFDHLYCNIDELGGGRNILNEKTARRILLRAERPPIKTHAWPGYEKTFFDTQPNGLPAAWKNWLRERAVVLYVYRDGRDVMCSYHLFRQSYDPSARCSIGTFLRQKENGLNRVQRWRRHVQAWRSESDAHLIQFEQILQNPKHIVRKLSRILDLDPLWDDPVIPHPYESIWERRWYRIFSTHPESTAIINDKNKDWRKSFTAEDRSFFGDEARGVMGELGYEVN